MSQILNSILFSTLLFIIFHYTYSAKSQCVCTEYKDCLNQTHWHAKHQFARCQRRCEKRLSEQVGLLPKEYLTCLKEFDTVFTRIMKCTTRHVGFGCTNNKHNAVKNMDLTLYHKMINDQWTEYMNNKSLNLIYKSTEAEDFNTCLLECFHPTVNTCTERLNCGLLSPSNDMLFNIFYTCGEKADFTQSFMTRVVTCLHHVMEEDLETEK